MSSQLDEYAHCETIIKVACLGSTKNLSKLQDYYYPLSQDHVRVKPTIDDSQPYNQLHFQRCQKHHVSQCPEMEREWAPQPDAGSVGP